MNVRYKKICVVFDLPLRIIRQRCVKEKRLSLKEAERMWRAFQEGKPNAEQLKREGFEDVYFMKGSCSKILPTTMYESKG